MGVRIVSLVTDSAPQWASEHLLLAAYVLRQTRPDLHFAVVLAREGTVPPELDRRLADLGLNSVAALTASSAPPVIRSHCDRSDLLVVAADKLDASWSWIQRLARTRPLLVSRGLVLPGSRPRRGTQVDLWDPHQVAESIDRELVRSKRARRPPASDAPWRQGRREAVLRQHSSTVRPP